MLPGVSRLLPLLLALSLLPIVGACAQLGLTCRFTIAEGPPDGSLTEGDPLPSGLALIAGPADFDRSATKVGPDQSGGETIDFALKGDASARLSGYTAGHVGGYLVVAVDGTIVASPVVRDAIVDGRMTMSFSDTTTPGIAARAKECAA